MKTLRKGDEVRRTPCWRSERRQNKKQEGIPTSELKVGGPVFRGQLAQKSLLCLYRYHLLWVIRRKGKRRGCKGEGDDVRVGKEKETPSH